MNCGISPSLEKPGLVSSAMLCWPQFARVVLFVDYYTNFSLYSEVQYTIRSAPRAKLFFFLVK